MTQNETAAGMPGRTIRVAVVGVGNCASSLIQGRLEDLRGKLVWLNFWATWCPPCQAETPVLREMDERYRDRGLAIVAVAVQETTVDDVRAYAERYELDYPIAFDASADIFDLYKVFALPTQFFIGEDGRVREVVNGPLTREAIEARLDAWLP